jgi:hypothetical protein
MDETTKAKLTNAIYAHDKRAMRGKYWNYYAIGIMLSALDQAEADMVKRGSTLAQALYDHFNDRLLTRLEKAVGLEPTYGGGGKDRGRPVA